ncbi:UNVERIFIED_ORG: hypothetical protein E4P37_15180 [Bacillus sp. AZ43]
MAADDPTPQPAPQESRFRWVARGVVAAIGLWFVADGLSGDSTTALVVVAVVVAVVLLAVGVVHLRRR